MEQLELPLIYKIYCLGKCGDFMETDDAKQTIEYTCCVKCTANALGLSSEEVETRFGSRDEKKSTQV